MNSSSCWLRLSKKWPVVVESDNSSNDVWMMHLYQFMHHKYLWRHNSIVKILPRKSSSFKTTRGQQAAEKTEKLQGPLVLEA